MVEPAALKAALQACTFKRELVLISVSESSFDAAFQTMKQLRQAGCRYSATNQPLLRVLHDGANNVIFIICVSY